MQSSLLQTFHEMLISFAVSPCVWHSFLSQSLSLMSVSFRTLSPPQCFCSCISHLWTARVESLQHHSFMSPGRATIPFIWPRKPLWMCWEMHLSSPFVRSSGSRCISHPDCLLSQPPEYTAPEGSSLYPAFKALYLSHHQLMSAGASVSARCAAVPASYLLLPQHPSAPSLVQ